MQADTKTQLLDAAEAVARRRGFDGFSYADLATTVGIRKASIHYHFATKAALAEALMTRYHKMVGTELDRIAGQEPTAGRRLRALITFYRDATQNGQQLCLCVAFSPSRDSLPDSLDIQMSAYRQMIISWLENVFAQAASDGTVTYLTYATTEAPALLALLEGAQLAARTEQDAAAFDRATALMMGRLL
ncbi:MAG: TetR/AcrR family transcriptional regulator [Pseudomonadota bacterium]